MELQRRPGIGAQVKMTSRTWWYPPVVVLVLASLTLLLALDSADAGHFYTATRSKSLQRFGKRWTVSPEQQRDFAELSTLLSQNRRRTNKPQRLDDVDDEEPAQTLFTAAAADDDDDEAAMPLPGLKRKWRNIYDEDEDDDQVEPYYEPKSKRGPRRGYARFLPSGNMMARYEGGEDGDY